MVAEERQQDEAGGNGPEKDAEGDGEQDAARSAEIIGCLRRVLQGGEVRLRQRRRRAAQEGNEVGVDDGQTAGTAAVRARGQVLGVGALGDRRHGIVWRHGGSPIGWEAGTGGLRRDRGT